MAKHLCVLWAQLAKNPKDESVRAQVRQHLADLVEHVDDCEECRAVSQSLTSPLEVFDALGDEVVDLSAEERQAVTAMDKALSDDEKAIDEAVEDVLLPSLPEHLESVKKTHHGLTNLQIFLAVNAVNLLIASYASRKKGQRIRLSKYGFTLGGVVTSRRESLVGEIESNTRATAKVAEALFDWQLEVAEHCSGLYLDLTVVDRAKGVLTLELDAPTLAHDLVERWRRTLTQPQKEEDYFVPAALTQEPAYAYLEKAYAMTNAQLKAARALTERAKTERQRALVRGFHKQIGALTKEASQMKQMLGPYAPKAATKATIKGAQSARFLDVFQKMKHAQEKKTVLWTKIAATGKSQHGHAGPFQKYANEQLKTSRQTMRRFDALMKSKFTAS